MAASNDQTERECPLCMEQLELDDLNFYPCTCEYQICRFCWHRIRTDGNCLCPACRKHYPEDPVNFKPLSVEDVQKIKNEKKLKDQQKKHKVAENRKHLANLRVVQKNLVFVVGLPSRLADADLLKRQEYFGKFGKIQKIMVNSQSTYVGSQGPSASAFVTYFRPDEALKAIQGVNAMSSGDGKTLKASLGTTKYCSNFLKSQPCAKPDCMYLHDVGDMEASFTKDEMQQGKHTEYEKRLIDQIKVSLDVASDGKSGVGCSFSLQNGEEEQPRPVESVPPMHPPDPPPTSTPPAPSSSVPSINGPSSTADPNLPPRYARQQANRRNRGRQANKHHKSKSPPMNTKQAGDSQNRPVRQSSGSSRASSSGVPSPTGHSGGSRYTSNSNNPHHGLTNGFMHHGAGHHRHSGSSSISPPNGSSNYNNNNSKANSSTLNSSNSSSSVHPLLSCKPKPTPLLNITVQHPFQNQNGISVGHGGGPGAASTAPNGAIPPPQNRGTTANSHAGPNPTQNNLSSSSAASLAQPHPLSPSNNTATRGGNPRSAIPSTTAVTSVNPVVSPVQQTIPAAKLANKTVKDVIPAQSTGDPVVLSPDELTVDTTGTDWQAAFGFKTVPPALPLSQPPAVTKMQHQLEDDLEFDPYAESCKGLAVLLDEEKRAGGFFFDPHPKRIRPQPGEMVGIRPPAFHPHHQYHPHVLSPFRSHSAMQQQSTQHLGHDLGTQTPVGSNASGLHQSSHTHLRHPAICDSSMMRPPHLQHHALNPNVSAPAAMSQIWLNDSASFAQRSVFPDAVQSGWPVNGSHVTPTGPSIS